MDCGSYGGIKYRPNSPCGRGRLRRWHAGGRRVSECERFRIQDWETSGKGWPDHCVQGTDGASIAKDINIPHAQLVIRKGYHNDVDSYWAFLEADKETRTGLASY